MTTQIVPSISDEQLAELEADAIARSKLGIDQCEGGKRITRSYACSHCGAGHTDGCRRPLPKRYDDSRAVLGLIARLRAAEADDWIPIESAPLDGSEILLMRGERVTSGARIEWTTTCPEYHSSTGAYLGQSEQDSGASWASWDGGFTEEEPPTHWKRLPKPKAMERTP